MNYSYLGQVLDHSQIAKNDFKQKSVMWDFNDKLSLHYGDRNTRAFVAHSYHTQQIKSKNGNDDKGDKTKDNLFEDLNQVTKYTVYQMNNAIDSTRKRWLTHVVDPFFALVYPIIVFEGNMFTGELINDKIKLNESDHVVLEYRYQPRYVDGPKSYYIDVVKKDYFSHFLNSLKIEISNIHRSLKNSEKEIKANARFHQKYFDATKDTL